MNNIKPYTIANLLTLGRLLAIPAVVFLLFKSQQIPKYQTVVLILLICMQVSDILDGYFARLDKKKGVTGNPFGEFMDPVADKLYINATYITLSLTHAFPVWITVIIFSRDLFLTVGWGVLIFITKDTSIKPNFWGKVCDSCQAIYIIAFLFNIPSSFLNFGAILTVSVTIISGISYSLQGLSTSGLLKS